MLIAEKLLPGVFSIGARSLRISILSCSLALTGMWALTAVAAPSWLSSLEANCNAGQAQDCLNAGSAYMRGEFDSKKVEKNKKKAKVLIREGLKLGEQSCKRKNLHDCYVIGVVYFEGELYPADFARGLEYLQVSCRGGYKEACIWLENSGLRM